MTSLPDLLDRHLSTWIRLDDLDQRVVVWTKDGDRVTYEETDDGWTVQTRDFFFSSRLGPAAKAAELIGLIVGGGR